jgi:hypothetical protein
VPVCQVVLQLSGCVQSLGLEYVDDVASGDDDDGMAVFADLCVGLGVEVGRGDQDAELTVAQPGDQPAGCANFDAGAGCEAFGFQGELARDEVGAGAEEVVANGVTAAVAPGPVTSILSTLGWLARQTGRPGSRKRGTGRPQKAVPSRP